MSKASYWSSKIDFAKTNPHRPSHLPFTLFLSLASGAIDVFSVPALGVFTANGTGNIIFLALAACQLRDTDPSTLDPVAAITSLAGCWLGSFFSGQLGHRLGASKRWFVLFTSAIETILIFIIAGLYYGGVIHYHDQKTEYAAICILAFTMGSQNVTASGVATPPTIPIQVATGAMAKFFADPRLFALDNRPRNERLVFVLTFFLGGLCGGFAYRYSTPQLCLIITGVFKVLAIGSILAIRNQPAPNSKSDSLPSS